MRAVADAAHARGVPLIVDNTVATPLLLKPIEHGADVVVHSLTKFVGGHGTTLGGVIVDGGTFPWAEHAERFPGLNQPEPAFHGVVYAQQFPDTAYVVRCRTVGMRNTGSTLSPFNAFMLLQGLETLPVRLERHQANARAVAEYLAADPRVAWVSFAAFPDHPCHELAQRYLGGRCPSIVTFGTAGGYDAGIRFFNRVNLFKRVVNMGDAKSLVAHPASTTHRQLERIDDHLEDINQALRTDEA